MHDLTRRSFVRNAALVLPAIALAPELLAKKGKRLNRFQIGIQEYTFHRWLGSGKLKHLDYPALAKKELGITHIEYWNRPFGGKHTDKKYVGELAKRTTGEGMKNVLLKMSEQELTYNVQENFGPFLGEVKLDSKPTAFPLKAYMSNAMVNGRLVLLADSAHIIHPLAGQGLNQGIKDIKTLIDNIIIYGFVPCALASYQQQRIRDNMRMFRITDALNMVFSNSSKSLFALRKPAFKLIEHSSALKTLFMSYAMGDW